MDIQELADPIEQYEAMTHVAKAADAEPVYDSIWVYDHFHTVPTPELATIFEAGRPRQPSPATPSASTSARWSPATATATRRCWQRWPPPWTCSATGGSTAASVPVGTSMSGAPTATASPRRATACAPSARPSRSSRRCGPRITQPSPASTTHRRPNQRTQGRHKPHPSFWIGGSGEQVTLKLVAQYADACNIFGDVETVRHKLDVLRQHCDTVGRNFDDITRSSSMEDSILLKPGENPDDAIHGPTAPQEPASWAPASRWSSIFSNSWTREPIT